MIEVLIFFIGTVIGSFLNVVIDRIPNNESIVKGRSYCDSCKHKLAWFDLIPLLSFILLCGKCRYCKAKISWQYPTVELATGLIFIFTISTLNSQLSIFFMWFILSSLLVIFVTDLKYYIIPDKILTPAFFAALLFTIYDLRFTIYELTNPLLSSIIAAGFFLLLVLITRGKGMGFGDVKYAAFMGLLLGYPAIIVGLYTAFLTGALLSVILLLLGKKKFGQTIPFGPFLVLGTVAGMFWGVF